MKASLPALAPLARVRLWLSYQRYAFVLIGGAALAIAALVHAAPWWLAAPGALLALVPLCFGVTVWARFPRKLRATRIALARIGSGRFQPTAVRAYCGDPCFRVVADEILRRAGHDRAARRALIARFKGELAAERDTLVFVDHARGVVMTFDGRSPPTTWGERHEPPPV